MPGLSLYQTEKDELQVVEAALQKGCKLIPDLDYPTAGYNLAETLEHYKQWRLQTRHFFIVSDIFFRFPLEVRKIEKGGKAVYYIFPRSGGPSIQFLGGGLFEEGGSNLIRPGAISYYPTYWIGRKTEKAPTQLSKTYNLLVESLKESSIRVKPGTRVHWLGPNAREAVCEGAKLVGYENLSADEVLRPAKREGTL